MWQGLKQIWQVDSTAGRLRGLASWAGWQVGQASMASRLAGLTAEWRPLMCLLAKRVCALDTGGSRETPGNYHYWEVQNGQPIFANAQRMDAPKKCNRRSSVVAKQSSN